MKRRMAGSAGKDKVAVKDPKSFSKRMPDKKSEPDVYPERKRPGAAALARKIGNRQL